MSEARVFDQNIWGYCEAHKEYQAADFKKGYHAQNEFCEGWKPGEPLEEELERIRKEFWEREFSPHQFEPRPDSPTICAKCGKRGLADVNKPFIDSLRWFDSYEGAKGLKTRLDNQWVEGFVVPEDGDEAGRVTVTAETVMGCLKELYWAYREVRKNREVAAGRIPR